MSGRTWLAVALAMAVWFGYLKFFGPPSPGETASSPATTQTPKLGEANTSPFAGVSEKAEVTDWLQSSDMKVGFSKAGGRPVVAEVTSHRKTIERDAPFMEPLNPEANPFAFATIFTDSTFAALSGGPYEVEKGEGWIRFQKSVQGLTLTKEYRTLEKGHFLDATWKLSGNAKGNMLVPLGGSGLTVDMAQPLESWEIVSFQNGEIKRTPLDSIEKSEEASQGLTQWLAFGNRYFASAIASLESSLNPDVVLSKQGKWVGAYLRYPLSQLGNKDLALKLKIFAGPKEVSELIEVPGMKGLVDFGMFKVFAYPLLEILRFFYRLFNNYGVAIILLTILVRLLFYPLSVKSYRSMKAMQKLQPQIQVIKARYKDDMARFNQEQMALFKAHKVNPFGGCLPMVVQIPVFFALYTVLSNSIDLFHAPFFGWIQDLSAKDPFYVLPLLMGISMFMQQKMTPSTGLDPMQQKMMLFVLPVVFTFVMLKLPSGLNLYMFLSTLLGVAQQAIINREPTGTGKLVTVSSPEGRSK